MYIVIPNGLSELYTSFRVPGNTLMGLKSVRLRYKKLYKQKRRNITLHPDICNDADFVVAGVTEVCPVENTRGLFHQGS